MNLDLSDQTDDVAAHKQTCGVWLMVGGFPVQLSWGQWFNLAKEVERFDREHFSGEAGEKDPRAADGRAGR